jgi:hypothetical protein
MPPKYKLQSILFDRSKFNKSSAKRWVLEHGFKSTKPDITENKIRIRQMSPASATRAGLTHYITKQIVDGVELILAYKQLTGGGAPKPNDERYNSDSQHNREALIVRWNRLIEENNDNERLIHELTQSLNTEVRPSIEHLRAIQHRTTAQNVELDDLLDIQNESQIMLDECLQLRQRLLPILEQLRRQLGVPTSHLN